MSHNRSVPSNTVSKATNPLRAQTVMSQDVEGSADHKSIQSHISHTSQGSINSHGSEPTKILSSHSANENEQTTNNNIETKCGKDIPPTLKQNNGARKSTPSISSICSLTNPIQRKQTSKSDWESESSATVFPYHENVDGAQVDELPQSMFESLELRLSRTRDSDFSQINEKLDLGELTRKRDEAEEKYPNFNVYLEQEELPINWPTNKKIYHTIGYGITTFASQFNASLISPSNEAIGKEFHVGREVGTLIFSIYVLGQTVGPMIFAPLSEVSGRKIGVFIPCMIAGIWTCVAACASSAWSLMVFRFIAGVFSAAPIVSSGGALGDLWKPKQRASALVLYSLCIIIGSAAAPVIGALLDVTGTYGWRWGCWLNGILQILLPTINLFTLTETYGPVLAKKKAQYLRHKTGVWDLHADLDMYSLSLSEFIQIHCMRPILMFATPIIFVLVIYCAFVYGLLFLAIATVGMEFQKYHHFSKVASYCPLLAIFPGFATGCFVNVLNSRRYARLSDKKGGNVHPEERLPAMMTAGWFMPCGLFIYGWTMNEHIHWFVPIIGIAFMGGGISIVFQGCLVYMVDVYTKYSASAIAANTVMRSVFGGVFPLFAYQMFVGMGIHWAASLLGFVGLILWPMSWVFYFTGARIRKYNPYGKLLS